MIDFRKELEKYDFVAVDAEFAGRYYETALAVEAFNATLKRIGKDLHKTNMQIEEVLSLYQDEKEKDRLLAEQKKLAAAFEEEKLSLVQGVVAALDRLEDIYRYALKNEQGGWAEQVRLLWRDTSADLLARGIIRIEGEHTLFDPRLHAAVQVKEEPETPSGLILEVLRCGYIYRAHLLRKAQVIVNKTDGGRESNEQHRGD